MTYAWHQTCQLEIEAFGETTCERGVPDHDDVLEERGSDVDVARHDRIVYEL